MNTQLFQQEVRQSRGKGLCGYICKNMTPLEFEELLAEFYMRRGYQCELTTNPEKGVDVVGRDLSNNQIVLFQAKRWSNTISPNDLKNYRLLDEFNEDPFYYITTGDLTGNARRKIHKFKKGDLGVIAGDKLERRIKRRDEEVLIKQYADGHTLSDIRENGKSALKERLNNIGVETTDFVLQSILQLPDGLRLLYKIETTYENCYIEYEDISEFLEDDLVDNAGDSLHKWLDENDRPELEILRSDSEDREYSWF